MTDRDHSFKDKIALVTGGSSGIGLTTARLLASKGANTWLLSRSRKRLEDSIQSLECEELLDCGIVIADVSDPTQVQNAVDQVVRQAGVPDYLINSAGITRPGYVTDLDLDVFQRLMQVNYFGTVYTCRAVIPGMRDRGSGHIVNICSVAGFLGVFGYSAYTATKYAVRGFSDVLRAELKSYGIGVSIVFPPDTDTPQLADEEQYKPPETKALVSNAHVISPELVARSILSGISKNRYIILPGFETKLLYWLSGILGSAVYPIMDVMISRARRKIK
jgi:3-dehydrosphinganine reductase